MTNNTRLGLPSASAFEILAECNGQQQLVRRLPPDVLALEKNAPDPLRDSGTKIHSARETGMLLELNKEEYALYQSGVNYEKRIVDKWKDVFSLQDVQEGPVELRLWIHEPGNMDPVCSGQLDVHYLAGHRALIVDWKTGFLSNLVGAKGNWQLKLQAVLLKIEHPELTDIRVSFAKPMFENSELDYADYNEHDLKYSLDSILYILWWSTQPDAPRRAGKHCLHCPAKTGCPEALALSLLPAAIANGTISGKEPAQAVTELTGDDLYRLWEVGSTIEAILKAVKARLKAMPEEELGALGIRLGKGREIMEWTDVKSAFEFLLTKGWPEKEIWDCLDFGVGKLAKLAEKMMGVDEKYAKEEVKSLLKNFWEPREGEGILRKLR